jgi:hypothetical protein
LTSAGHDVDTVAQEGLIGALDRHVAAAATAAGPILISLDRGSRHVITQTWCLAMMLSSSWAQVAAKPLFRCRTWSLSPTFPVLPSPDVL